MCYIQICTSKYVTYQLKKKKHVAIFFLRLQLSKCSIFEFFFFKFQYSCMTWRQTRNLKHGILYALKKINSIILTYAKINTENKSGTLNHYHKL